MVLESVVDLVLDPGAARPFDPVYGSGWRAWFYGFGVLLVHEVRGLSARNRRVCLAGLARFSRCCGMGGAVEEFGGFGGVQGRRFLKTMALGILSILTLRGRPFGRLDLFGMADRSGGLRVEASVPGLILVTPGSRGSLA